MGSKKKNMAATTGGNVTTLKIGSRVRCTDDGVEGRITWANGVAVKIQWDDGEQVTWKRDSLATRPIEILDAETPTDLEPNAQQPAVPTTAEETSAQEESSAQEEPPPSTPEVPPSEPIPDEAAPEAIPETTLTTPELTPTDGAVSEPLSFAEALQWNVLDASPESDTYLKVIGTVTAVTLGDAQAAAKTLYATPHIVQAPETAVSKTIAAEVPAANQPPTTTATEPKRTRKAKKAESATGGEKKVSAIDAAARVLAEEGRPMSCKELIGAMASKGYWTSPGGKTPDATLCSAILREISTKGNDARFVKTGRGHFARTNVA